jgi:hypothetical protein
MRYEALAPVSIEIVTDSDGRPGFKNLTLNPAEFVKAARRLLKAGDSLELRRQAAAELRRALARILKLRLIQCKPGLKLSDFRKSEVGSLIEEMDKCAPDSWVGTGIKGKVNAARNRLNPEVHDTPSSSHNQLTQACNDVESVAKAFGVWES